MQTSGSGISSLLAVGTTFTGSGNLYCQWELSPGSRNALCILFPTIHTIMQCLSPKRTGFNEFISNITTVVVCLATNRVYNFTKMIFDGMVRNINTPTKTLTPRRLTRRAIRIAQSKALSPDADEPASLLRDNRQEEAFPTVFSLDAGQDRENIAKTFAIPYESSSRVPSLDAVEGSMQQRIHELIELCTSLQRQQSQMVAKIQDQDLKISRGIKDIEDELRADKSTELGSNDTKEMINVLSSMEATNIFSSGGAAASVFPVDVLPTAGVPTVSGCFPTVSAIFTTANVVIPYTRRSKGITIGSSQHMRIPIIRAKDKGKEKVIETEVPKKRKLQEQIDAQVAREMEEEFARENQRLSEQLTSVSEIARIHAEEELKIMIEGLDRSNKVIVKRLSKYEEAEAEADLSQFNKEDLHQLWTLVKETFSIKQAIRDKEKELWVELKRLFEPDFEDQLWTHHQAFMRDPLDWKLYDTCGIHHVSTKDQEIFMLVEKDYPLRKGLATMMIIQDEELFEASSLGIPTASYGDPHASAFSYG
uniref:Synaptobrevin, longin-like domain protein n=1 Tax=Tanacetum cinerariifolium TaxID=118510 RepID=A0A699JCV2_TANCI|nr:synaptobrevin, longin-like domain protein [Tanacetum cinerariifolium]